jgi:large subunit ribosomal protein L24
MKIRKADLVKITKGNDRGKTGEVLIVDASKKRVVVKGVHVVKRHIKSQKNNPHGGIVDKTLPVPIANVMLLCPLCSKPTRVKFRVEENSKQRVCRHCQKAFK